MATVSRLSIIKFLELAIAIACIGLHNKSSPTYWEIDTLCVATFGGFIIILAGGFIGHLMATPINRRIDIFYSLVGCALFVASGALLIEHFEDKWDSEARRYGLAKGSLAVINGACFLIDSLLSWRGDF